mmetsp:Transcript_8276/g.12264  ORF Transcript_8276/g.12264 Transcript_8276/m.12264 type:complete len:759 (+) Transcript_8276:22-2298(+)
MTYKYHKPIYEQIDGLPGEDKRGVEELLKNIKDKKRKNQFYIDIEKLWAKTIKKEEKIKNLDRLLTKEELKKIGSEEKNHSKYLKRIRVVIDMYFKFMYFEKEESYCFIEAPKEESENSLIPNEKQCGIFIKKRKPKDRDENIEDIFKHKKKLIKYLRKNRQYREDTNEDMDVHRMNISGLIQDRKRCTKFCESIKHILLELYKLFRNTMHVFSYEIPYKKMNLVDKIQLYILNEHLKKIKTYYREFEMGKAVEEIETLMEECKELFKNKAYLKDLLDHEHSSNILISIIAMQLQVILAPMAPHTVESFSTDLYCRKYFVKEYDKKYAYQTIYNTKIDHDLEEKEDFKMIAECLLKLKQSIQNTKSNMYPTSQYIPMMQLKLYIPQEHPLQKLEKESYHFPTFFLKLLNVEEIKLERKMMNNAIQFDDKICNVQLYYTFEEQMERTIKNKLEIEFKNERDIQIVFMEESHVYKIDGDKCKVSVTGFIDSFFESFDSQSQAEKSQSQPKYQDLTTSQICRRWMYNGKKASQRGTHLHAHIEWLIDKYRLNLPKMKEYIQTVASNHFYRFDISMNAFLNFYEKEIILKNLEPFRVEMKIFLKTPLLLAGSVDGIFQERNQKGDGPKVIHLFDWKHSRKLEYGKYHYGSYGKPPIDDKVNSLEKYYFQLHIYAYILESFYKFKVKSMTVVNFYNGTCKLFRVPPNFKNKRPFQPMIKDMLDEYKQQYIETLTPKVKKISKFDEIDTKKTPTDDNTLFNSFF